MSGELRIGGLTLSCSEGHVEAVSVTGLRKRQGKEARRVLDQQSESASGTSSVDEGLQDYFENVADCETPTHSFETRSQAQPSGGDASALHFFRLHEDPRVEDVDIPGHGAMPSALGSSSDGGAASSSDAPSNDGEGAVQQSSGQELFPWSCGREWRGQANGSNAEGDRSLSARPDRHRPKPSAGPGSSARRKQTPAQQKRKMATFMTRLNQCLEDIVACQRDMEVIPVVDATKAALAIRLASLYGLQATLFRGRRDNLYMNVRSTSRSRQQHDAQTAEIAEMLLEFQGKGAGKAGRKKARQKQKGAGQSRPVLHREQSWHAEAAAEAAAAHVAGEDEVDGELAALMAEYDTLSTSTRPGENRAARSRKGEGPSSASRAQQAVAFVPCGHLADGEPAAAVTFEARRQQQGERLAHATAHDEGTPKTAADGTLQQPHSPDTAGAAEALPSRAGLGFGNAPGQADSAAAGAVSSEVTPQADPEAFVGSSRPAALDDCSEADPACRLQPDGSLGRADGAAPGSSPPDRVLPKLSVFVDLGEDQPRVPGEDQQQYLEQLDEMTKPSVLRTRAQCNKARKKLEKERRRLGRHGGGAVVAAPAEPPSPPGDRFAAFEQHTRGIGSKLLGEMGFGNVGRGLGREEQGMAEPLKAHLRPKRRGLGA